jgi:hypothetical protein
MSETPVVEARPSDAGAAGRGGVLAGRGWVRQYRRRWLRADAATLLWLGPVVGAVPRATIAGLVVAAALSIIDVAGFRALACRDRPGLVVAATAAVVVLVGGVLAGVAAALAVQAVVALARRTRRTRRRRRPGT